MKKILIILFILSGFVASSQTGYTLINSRYKWLAGLFDALGLPAGGNAAFTSGQAQRAGSVYYDSTGSDAGMYLWTGTAWVLQGTPAAAELPDGLISGGYVTYSGSGLKFYISPAVYRINGVIYGTAYDSVTLATADPDDPRKDVIYLATTGVEVLTGTPAGPAAEPQMEAGQIKLTVVDIQAGASVPTITTNIIYDENTGESTVTNVGTTTDPDNTEDPYHLTKAVEFTNVDNLDAGIFTLPSTVDITTYEGISMFLRLKGVMHSTARIYVTFGNGSNWISNEVQVTMNKNSLTYQGLTVPMSLFTFTNAFVDKVRIRWYQSSPVVHPGFYLDYVHFESGVQQPGGGSTPMTIGAIGSKLPSPNGAVIENNVFYQQPASQTYPGLLSAADKTKLDSLRSDYLMENVGDGEELATQVNDSTVGIKSLKAGTGVTLDATDTTITINSSGGGAQDLQSVTTIGNTTTDTVNAGAFGVTNGEIINESSDFTVRGKPGANLNLGANGTNGWFINSDGELSQSGAGDIGAYTFQNSLGTSYLKDLVFEYGTAPGTPSAGLGHLYTKSSDKKLYWKDDAGTEYDLTGGGGGGGGLSEIIAGYGLQNVNDSTLDVDSLVIANRDWVMDRIAESADDAIWNGGVIGTTFSATSATVNSGAVQWTFTGSIPETFTLPPRTSSVNQFYIFKNKGTANLTIAAAGTDDIFTTSVVTSVALLPGESTMLTGAANGTSDLWTELFHSSGSAPNVIVDTIPGSTSGTDVIVARNDSILHRLITTAYKFITVDTTSDGRIRIGLDTASADLKTYIADNSGAGSGTDRFSITLTTATNTTFTDAQSIYFSSFGAGATTLATAYAITIDRACTLKSINIDSYCNTAGSNESWSLYVRVNNTTDYLIEAVSASTNNRTWDNNAINISLNQGDVIVIKSINPTWATNPASGLFGGYAIFEY